MKINNTRDADQGGFGHLVIIFMLLVLLVVGGLGYKIYTTHSDKASSTKLKHVTVQLNWLHNAQFAGLYTAVAQGYYKQRGLDVTIKETSDTVDPIEEALSGRADYIITTPLEVILARDKGRDIKAIAAIHQTSPYVIVTRADANIKTPYDFKGKTLGNSGNNPEATITYAALLANAGLQPSDAPTKTIDFDIVKVFQNHDADTADIYRTDQTYQLKQANLPFNLVYPEQYGFAIYGDVLATSDKKISTDATTTKAFVDASIQGWQYALDHQSEALKFTAKYQNTLYNDANYEKYILAQEAPLIRPTGGQTVGNMQFIPWNRAYQGVKAAGLITKPITASDSYTTQFLD